MHLDKVDMGSHTKVCFLCDKMGACSRISPKGYADSAVTYTSSILNRDIAETPTIGTTSTLLMPKISP